MASLPQRPWSLGPGLHTAETHTEKQERRASWLWGHHPQTPAPESPGVSSHAGRPPVSPQYKILLRGCWYELFGGSPEDLPTELDGGDLTQPLLGEHSLLAHGSPAYSFSSESPLESPTRYPPLYPPGRIIHLEEEGASGR